MLDTIKVELVNNGITTSDIFSLASLVISGCSGLWVVWQHISRKRSEKMRLIVTPMLKVSNAIDERLSLYFIFLNESSRPISLLNMTISSDRRNDYIPETSEGFEGGSLLLKTVNIKKQNYTDFYDFESVSTLLPITIPQYDSKGHFFTFNAGGFSAEILTYRRITLEIITSRGNWKQTINLEPDNFMDFSYDGKTVFGKAVMPITKIQSFRNRAKKFFSL